MQQETSAPALHDHADAQRNSARIKRVLTVLGVIALVGVALVVCSLLWRDATHMNNPHEKASQWITIAVTLVWGGLIIFLWDMKLSPLLSYRRYLREIHSGLSREVRGVLVEIDEGLIYREGLNFYRLVINIGDVQEPEDERVLYWDAQLGSPGLILGDRILARAHGNDIIALKKL